MCRVDLKGCPFCPDGGKPHKYMDDDVNTIYVGGRTVYVGCEKCGVNLRAVNYPQMDGTWRMSKNIVSTWNNRPKPSTGMEEVTVEHLFAQVTDTYLGQAAVNAVREADKTGDSRSQAAYSAIKKQVLHELGLYLARHKNGLKIIGGEGEK